MGRTRTRSKRSVSRSRSTAAAVWRPSARLPDGKGAPAAPGSVYHESQVRYLIADMQLGGSPDYYRRWAVEEKDPDSIRALREWEAGMRLLRPELYERIDVEFAQGKGKRIVYKGTRRTVPGTRSGSPPICGTSKPRCGTSWPT